MGMHHGLLPCVGVHKPQTPNLRMRALVHSPARHLNLETMPCNQAKATTCVKEVHPCSGGCTTQRNTARRNWGPSRAVGDHRECKVGQVPGVWEPLQAQPLQGLMGLSELARCKARKQFSVPDAHRHTPLLEPTNAPNALPPGAPRHAIISTLRRHGRIVISVATAHAGVLLLLAQRVGCNGP